MKIRLAFLFDTLDIPAMPPLPGGIMAHWIFRQLNGAPHTSSRWAWELARDNERLRRQSARSFETLQDCTDDASHYGYYAGHYHVSVVTPAAEQGAPARLVGERNSRALAVVL